MIIVVASSIIVTGLLVRREFFAPEPASEADPQDTVSDWRQYAAHGQRMGAPNTPVTVVVFSDFQCPACKALAARLRAIRASHPLEVAEVYRHFPLPGHPYAIAAARASECASRQGRFEAYHDALFAERSAIGHVKWLHFAQAARISDDSAFERCVSDTSTTPAFARDTLDGSRLGVDVTPTLLINEVEVRGTPRLEHLQYLIDRSAKQGNRQ